MMRLSGFVFPCLFTAMLFIGCSVNTAESRMEKLARDYSEDKINNLQMLLAMGEIYLANPDNETVKKDYFTRMIISGYSAWVVHHYLKDEKPLTDTDQELILTAIKEGGLYSAGLQFEQRFSTQFQPVLYANIALADTLEKFDQLVLDRNDAESFAKRSAFFASLEKVEMAQADIEKSMQLSPCNDEAVYRLSLHYIDRENPDALLELFSRCISSETDTPEWKSVFPMVAAQVKAVRNSNESDEQKLFKLANLYVNNGFTQIALRKTQELLAIDSENADYLAIQAFVYYRLGEKQNALDLISKAETASGRTSRLRSMIEQME